MTYFRKVAVLGAGVMGAQIAAHCANAGIAVMLFDLTGSGADKNEIVKKALAGLKKLEPAPLADAGLIDVIASANYEQDLPRLAECDLIIEAIAEKLTWKQELYQKIAPHLRQGVAIASNTSGLSINSLAEFLPAEQRNRFCGVHFFNPTRYMALVELIPTQYSDADLLDQLETWLVSSLGKRIVRAKDTPNFIANRIGVFALLAAIHHTARLKLSFDEVDALTGPLIGRPKSATFRTLDVVGLDTMSHVIATLANNAKDSWQQYYQELAWLQALIAKGALGQKAKMGIYCKQGRAIQVLNADSGAYQPSSGQAAPEVVAMLKEKNPVERLRSLRNSKHPQAQLLWSIYRDTLHYSACLLAEIAESARDIDQAMRWGFGWQQGPFELWQAAGWAEMTAAIKSDIAAGLAMSSAALPAWVDTVSAAHTAQGSWSATHNAYVSRATLPVYQRQLVPPRLLGEATPPRGETLFDNGDVRLWRHALAPTIAILSVNSKMHTLGANVLAGMNQCIEQAERDCQGLVVWQEAPFAVGANLKEAAEKFAVGDYVALDHYINDFQQTMQHFKYAKIPTVAAVSGLALGGGCELVMHCNRRVAAFESYIGLVEVGVGLIPSGGGCKEFAIRTAKIAARSSGKDNFPFMEPIFNQIAMGKTSRSAPEALKMGYLTSRDCIMMNSDEILYAALLLAQNMAQIGYQPPLPETRIPVLGRAGIANFEMNLVNMQDGGFISAHDYRVSKAVATALCGGEVDKGTLVNEQWILDVERALFVDLLKSKETAARIMHMLETGKPLRN